jgi:hypothetical protein
VDGAASSRTLAPAAANYLQNETTASDRLLFDTAFDTGPNTHHIFPQLLYIMASDLETLIEMGFEPIRAEMAVKKTGGCKYPLSIYFT